MASPPGLLLFVLVPSALTRMYNQPVRIDEKGRTVGTLYRGPLHCLYLTAKKEGPLAWYKVSPSHKKAGPRLCTGRNADKASRLTSRFLNAGHDGSPGKDSTAHCPHTRHERGIPGELRMQKLPCPRLGLERDLLRALHVNRE